MFGAFAQLGVGIVCGTTIGAAMGMALVDSATMGAGVGVALGSVVAAMLLSLGA